MPDLGQREAGRLAGLKGNWYQALETGFRANPASHGPIAIATLYGVSLDWLMLGKGDLPDAETVRLKVDAARARWAAGPSAVPGVDSMCSEGST